MPKKFLNLAGLLSFLNEIREMFNKRIQENMKIEVYNDYWVIFSQDEDQEHEGGSN